MTDDQIEIFLHVEGQKPRLETAKSAESLREVLLRAGVIQDAEKDVVIFVGEWDEALREPAEVEDGADAHDPVDIDRTLRDLDLGRHRHVHRHGCRHVAVEVHFGGDTKRHRFSPATTIEVTTLWARKKFKLEGAAGDEYVLQICGTTDQPRSDEHLSDLAKSPGCALCFNLVKEVNPQG